MSIAKQLQDLVFRLNRGVPVFTREWSITIADFYKELPPGLMALSGAGASDPVVGQLLSLHKLLRWARFGMPVFSLTHSAAAAFSLTDSDSVPTTNFRPPFSTFLIQLPTPWLTLDDGAAIRGFFWHEARDAERHRVLIRAIGENPRKALLEGITPHPCEFKTIGDWLNRPTLAEGLSRPLVLTLARLLVSMCLYITANGRGEPLSKSAKRIDASPGYVAAGTEPAIWMTGREVKIDRALVQAAVDFSESDRKGATGWKLRSRFTVRGHFRNQAHGPGRALRKLRWIEPHWKGPRDGVGIAHLYDPKTR